MEIRFRKPRRRLVSWKQIPAVALAGCALANGADSPASPAILRARAGHDWSVSASWLRACRLPADWTAPKPFLFQRDYVLGTSFDLVVWTTQAQEAARVEGVVLAEIDRLCRILSRYDSQSEISRLNAGFSLSAASPDLIAILRAYEIWTARTGGALSGRLGGLIDLWKAAEVAGTPPSIADLATCIEDLRAPGPGWRIDSQTGRVGRLGHQPLNVDSLVKGYILQKAVEAARAGFSGIRGIMLNIGGDISVYGSGGAEAGVPWRIFCADPRQPSDNAAALTSIELSHGAVATSAAYERGFTVAGKRYSHILDPRTGWPAEGVASATAVARDSMTANALATALCVLTPDEGLGLLRSIEGVEALIVLADGTPFRTPRFGALETPLAQVSPVSDSTTSAPSSMPSPVPPASGTPATTGAPPVSAGQTVTIVTDDQVSFVKGMGRITRPVQPDEKFRVVSVIGDQVTVADLFGYEATLNRNSLKIEETPPAPAPAPVATTSAVTNTAPQPAVIPSNTASTSAWPVPYQVTLGLELPPAPPTAKRPERPYVAIWVEDADGKPVRTISVWGINPKYLSDLSNWWSFAGNEKQLISNTTRATRPAGKYQVFWDGLDDEGKPVARGSYTVVLEVAREFGSHQTHRATIECGDVPAQGTIPGATEFLDCPITYGPPGT